MDAGGRTSLFRSIARFFGVGLVTVLPFALVIWVLVAIFRWVDGLLGPRIDKISGLQIPGLGFVLVIVGVTLAGALANLYISHRIYVAMDRLFTRIPFVKSLYSMFKELVQNLVLQRRGFVRSVFVEWPDERALVIGLVTNERLPSEIDPTGELLAVYLPNTFQFSGLTILVDSNRVRPCQLSVSEAFKFAISAGLGQNGTASAVRPPEHKSAAPVQAPRVN